MLCSNASFFYFYIVLLYLSVSYVVYVCVLV